MPSGMSSGLTKVYAPIADRLAISSASPARNSARCGPASIARLFSGSLSVFVDGASAATVTGASPPLDSDGSVSGTRDASSARCTKSSEEVVTCRECAILPVAGLYRMWPGSAVTRSPSRPRYTIGRALFEVLAVPGCHMYVDEA